MNRKQLNESIHKNARLARVHEIREQQENLNREYQYQLMLLERRLYQQNDGQVPPPGPPGPPNQMSPGQGNPGLPYHETNNPLGYPVPSPGFGGGPKRPVPNGPAFPGWPRPRPFSEWPYGYGNMWFYHPWGIPLYPFAQPPANVTFPPGQVPPPPGVPMM